MSGSIRIAFRNIRATAGVLPSVAFLAVCLLAPNLSFAAPTVMVDAIPSGGEFINSAKAPILIQNLESADPKAVETRLAQLIAQLTPYAQENGATHMCLLSSATEDTRSFMVEAAHAQLKLQLKEAQLVVVLYRSGANSSERVMFSVGKPDRKGGTQSIRIKMVSVPEGWTTESWVYFNLPRIQGEALKAGATQVFLTATGKGAKSSVIIPGSSAPLQVYEKETELQATWYIDGK